MYFITDETCLKDHGCILRPPVYKDHLMRSQQCMNYDPHTETTSVQRPLFSGPYVVVIGRFHCSMFVL